MKKYLIVIMLNKSEKGHIINILDIEIRCNESDQQSIKHSLESHKNNPSLLLSIMTQNVPHDIIVKNKTTFDTVKHMVETCESLVVDFIDIAELEKKLQEYQNNKAVFYNFC